ncbi:MAG: hypothetical protein ACRDGJ_07080 [Candidatus Limnocylindria bacterium]
MSALLAGETPAVATAAARDPGLRPLVETARLLRTALATPPLSVRFEARLGARLAESGLLERGLERARALGHPNRLLVGAAVGSAAVGVGVTALAVWRSSRRAGLAGRVHR